MGYEYYLCKSSDASVFELGKGGLRSAFDRMPGAVVENASGIYTVTLRLKAEDAPFLASRLQTEFGYGWTLDDAAGYASRLAQKICVWADGHEVVHVGEAHPFIDGEHSTYRDQNGDLRVAGTRYE